MMASNISPRKRPKDAKKITDFFPPSPSSACESDKSDDPIPDKKKDVAEERKEDDKPQKEADTNEQSAKQDATSSPAYSKGRKGRRRGGRKKKTTPPVTNEEQSKPDVKVDSSKTATTQRKKKDKSAHLDSHKLTEYFPVRRSDRRCKTDIEKQNKLELEDAILTGKEDGMKIFEFPQKGRGIIADKDFRRGDFVVEYAGDLIDLTAAKEREKKYGENAEIGCYMYYFRHRNKSYCVDATKESGRLGRLINHSSKTGNCMTRVVGIGDRPYLILVAGRDIKKGEELLYDYGDRNKDSLQSHPWLAS